MKFFHTREHLNQGDIVEVNCSHQCNIILTTDSNFANCRSGRKFQYHGGHYETLPARIVVSSNGWWKITLDLGGSSATIKHSIRTIQA